MNFEDRTLVALADPATRGDVFDQPALESILDAGYDAASMAITGPFEPVFDQLSLGTSVPTVGTVDGNWRVAGSVEQTDVHLELSGLAAQSSVRVDGLWLGSIIARSATVGEPITGLTLSWSDAGSIDAEIVAANGSLPADPAALEQARRARLLAHIRAGLDQPAAFGDSQLDSWLDKAGATSVGDLTQHRLGLADGAALKVTFAAPLPAGDTPTPLQIAAPILIRDTAELSIAQLLADSKSIRERLSAGGVARPQANGTRPRQMVVVVWVLPITVFDDPDWPGAAAGQTADQARAARRAAASGWLADEGIGLATAAEAPS